LARSTVEVLTSMTLSSSCGSVVGEVAADAAAGVERDRVERAARLEDGRHSDSTPS
jgi:hypothetical protein